MDKMYLCTKYIISIYYSEGDRDLTIFFFNMKSMVNLKVMLCWYNTHPIPKIYVHTSISICKSKMLRNMVKTKFNTRTDG